MEHTTISPPICAKHGCEKTWYKDGSRKAGGVWRCKTCKSEQAREWALLNPEKARENHLRWSRANAEHVLTYRREWRASNRDADNQHKRDWARKNPEKVLAGQRNYKRLNCERVKARDAEYRRAHAEEARATCQRRHARKRAATSPLAVVTAAAIAERFALTDGCAYCGVDAKKTVEHVVPFKLGGLHVPSNLVGACHSCNSSKNASPVEEWFKAQPFFSEQRWQRIQEITGNGQLSLI